MIVVTNTAMVLNLCGLGMERLLHDLFGEVLAPPSVAGGFDRLAGVDKRFLSLVFPTFIQLIAPAQIVYELVGNQKLHAGEIDAWSLALAQKADAVLMDESAGRAAAADLGLRSVGILGMLIQAKSIGLLVAVGPLLQELETKACFWNGPVAAPTGSGLG